MQRRVETEQDFFITIKSGFEEIHTLAETILVTDRSKSETLSGIISTLCDYYSNVVRQFEDNHAATNCLE